MPLPERLTLVLGTGCWQCGGQHSTYELFGSEGRTILHDVADEVHLSGEFSDPDHLYLAGCASDCNLYEEPVDPQTTLYESFDRGSTWTPIQTTETMYAILGRTSDRELLIRQWAPRTDAMYYRFPSGVTVEPPVAAAEDSLPLIVGGEPWWLSTNHTLVDGAGSVVADFSGALPRHAKIRGISDSPQGGRAVGWLDGRTWGLTVWKDGAARTYLGVAIDELIWLDEQHLIASVGYTAAALAEIGADTRLSGSRTPTIIDLEAGTLHPIDEFLQVDADVPTGRNQIQVIWQD